MITIMPPGPMNVTFGTLVTVVCTTIAKATDITWYAYYSNGLVKQGTSRINDFVTTDNVIITSSRQNFSEFQFIASNIALISLDCKTEDSNNNIVSSKRMHIAVKSKLNYVLAKGSLFSAGIE